VQTVAAAVQTLFPVPAPVRATRPARGAGMLAQAAAIGFALAPLVAMIAAWCEVA
jgi:hypothetical protein